MFFAGAMSLVAATSAHAAASGWSGASGASGAGCYVNEADNSTNTTFGYFLESQTASAVTWTTNYIENETKVDEVAVATHDSNTDVIYNDGYYSTQSGPPCVANSQWWPTGGVIGYTVCWSLTSWDGCQQHRIYADTDWVYDSANTPGWDQALILHESGHGLGLTHPSTNVANEVMSPSLPEIDYYSANDKSLIQNDLPN